MKNFYTSKNQSENVHRSLFSFFCLAAFLFLFSFNTVAQVTVNSLEELLPYLDDDNVDVKLAPGTYTVTASDISKGTFTDFTIINGNKAYVLFLFEGNNSTYDFTGAKVNVETAVFNAIPSDAGDFFECQVVGSNNVLKNLTIEDIGSVHDYPKYGCVNIVMDGRDNRIEGFHITTRGSFPYGYGDCFGKGGTYTIKHWKHSAFLVRGLRNHALNDTILHYSYGHALFMQAASYPRIEGCYIEGEVRSTDDMLAEEGTGSPADLIDFYTVWGYRLPAGFMKALGEGGIRAYNGGNTVVDGVESSHGTDNPTIINNYVKNLRTGVTLTHATGTKYVEGCTTIGTERGFAIGSGDIVNCFSDAQYGPVFGVDYESDRNINVEITVLPYEGETYNGDKYLAYIVGSGHNITFHSQVNNPDQDLKIEFGGDRRIIANLYSTENYKAENITLNNYTNYPIVLNSISKGNSGVSGGMVTDFGTNNNFSKVPVSVGKYEAEDFSTQSGITTEVTSDEGLGENVTSIDLGDYMEYQVDVPFAGTYLIDYRVASAATDGSFSVFVENELLEDLTFDATGASQSWSSITSLAPVSLEKGSQTIKISSNSDAWNLNWFNLTLVCAKVDIKPYIEVYSPIGQTVSIEDSLFEVLVFPGNSLSLQPKPAIGGTWSWTGPNGFTAESRVIELNDVDYNDAGEYVATISNDCGEQSTATFTVLVTGSVLVEAESYSNSSGVSSVITSDEGAGEHVTSIDVDDWMEYSINVPVSATYTIDYRIASESTGGDFKLSVDGEVIEQHTFDATGAADTWLTSSSSKSIYFTEGEHTLRITANSAGWNLNWLKLLGQAYVSPCNLPFEMDGFLVQNETMNWTSGLMDISCVDQVNTYVELSEIGSLTASDSLNIYYRLDGAELIPIAKNTGGLIDTVIVLKELSATTFELIIQGASASMDNYYRVDKISLVETTDPFARIEAEEYDDMEGVSSSGTRLGSIQPGDWSMYAGLDLTGVRSIDASVGTVYSDAYIEVRLDAVDGPLIGTIEVPNTGNYNTYRTASTYVDEYTGIYDVYLVYQTESSPNVCNIDWFQFSDKFVKRPTNPYDRFEAEINDDQKGTLASTTTDVDGDQELGDLEDGDYVMFSALSLQDADAIDVRVASALDGGVIEVRLGSASGRIIAFIDVPNTGGENMWQTVSTRVDEVEGEDDVYFVVRGEGSDLFKLNWLQFTKYESPFVRLEAEDNDDSEGSFFSGETSDEADNGIGSILRFTKPDNWVQFKDLDLTGAKSVNTRYATSYEDTYVEVRLDALDGELIGTIALDNTEGWSNWETASASISEVSGVHDVFFVYKSETSSVVCSSNWFQFSGLSVAEPIIPQTRIEAEDYSRANGTLTMATSDVDGESEVGAIENNNWLLFKNIDLTDVTGIDVRVANPTASHLIYFRLNSYDGDLLSFISIPVTGSSSTWQTISSTTLWSKSGVHDVYVVFKGSASELTSINWLQFKGVSSGISSPDMASSVQLYPNPFVDGFTIKGAEGSKVMLYGILGNLISESYVEGNEQTINMSELKPGNYFARIIHKDGSSKTIKVIKK